MLLRDVLVTGTGLAVILIQAFAGHPSSLLLGTGLALTVPSVAAHVKALLPASTVVPSSPSSGESSSSSSSGG